MFRLHDFIMKGLLDAVGKMWDYQVILNAMGWYEKGVLTDDDMAVLQAAIDARFLAEEAVQDVNADVLS